MSKTIIMEIFRAGKQTDSSGHEKDWTESDLDKIIEATNKVGEDVPATVGHPKDNSPAFAWFKAPKLFREGKVLMAKMGDITKKFGEALKNKNFKNRSIALRPDLSLRHIAFLGGTMPAVKGLADFKFKENDEFSSYEFGIGENDFADFQTTFGFRTVGRIFQRIRDRKIEKDGVEKADDVISQFDIDELKNMRPDPIVEPSFSEPTPGQEPDNGGKDMSFTEKEFKDLQDKNTQLTTDLEVKTTESKDFSDKFTASEAKVTTLENEKLAIAKEVKDKEFIELAEKYVADGHILPAEKESILITLKALDGQEAFDFKEADGTVVKRTPLDNYKLTIEAKKGGIIAGGAFNDVSVDAGTAESEISKKTDEIMEKQKVNFTEASKILRKKEPGLFKELIITQELKED